MLKPSSQCFTQTDELLGFPTIQEESQVLITFYIKHIYCLEELSELSLTLLFITYFIKTIIIMDLFQSSSVQKRVTELLSGVRIEYL
jgi:hypothetical protein